MDTIGITQTEQNEIFRNLASVLWIGNCTFRENNQGNAEVVDGSIPEFIAYLLEVDSTQVTTALTQKTVETQRGGRRGSIYDSPLNVPQALAARDALAKAIYNALFDWIVERVNKSMKARERAEQIIGILDIYGFEIFQGKFNEHSVK
jgi:myosin I